MKYFMSTTTTLLLLASTSFAITAPKGEYIDLSCVSVDRKPSFKLQIVRNTESSLVKMVLVPKVGPEQVYAPVTVTLPPKGMAGGSTVYRAPSMGGMVSLIYNPTTSPGKLGRRATLSSSAMGLTTNTEMACATVKY